MRKADSLGHSRPVTGLLYLYIFEQGIRLRTGRSGVLIPIGAKDFYVLWKPSNQVLGPTQPLLQWTHKVLYIPLFWKHATLPAHPKILDLDT